MALMSQPGSSKPFDLNRHLNLTLHYVLFYILDDIREYFGDTIAMYFGFLGFYSMCLVPPVLLVVVFSLSGAHDQTKNTVFAVLNLVWGTVFLEAWKRRCSEISFKWGNLKTGIGELILTPQGVLPKIFVGLYSSLLETFSYHILDHRKL